MKNAAQLSKMSASIPVLLSQQCVSSAECSADEDCEGSNVSCLNGSCIQGALRPPSAAQCGYECDSDDFCVLVSPEGACTACLPENGGNGGKTSRCRKPKKN